MIYTLGAGDFKTSPWKNGGGSTTELYRLSDADDGFFLRLSRANVPSDGPFSLFPGIERQLVLLKGAGLELTLPSGDKKILTRDSVFEFSGDDALTCKLLRGPCEDFNVMIKRDWGKAVVRVHQASGETIRVENCQYAFAYDVTARTLTIADGEALAFSPGPGPVILVSVTRL